MISEKKSLKLRDGINLHLEIMESGSPYWLVITHGLGEHCERHSYMYEMFAHYFNICLYDLRGHGKSDGKKAYIANFKDYVQDLGEVLDYLQDQYKMDKFVLFGHSMGGLITASYMQNEVQQELYPLKVFLSAPAVAPPGKLGRMLDLAPLKVLNLLEDIPVSLPLEGLLDLSRLSHDLRVYENYLTDELNSLKVHTKLIFEILAESRAVFSRPLRVSCDLFCAVGTADGLVDPQSVIKYFSTVEKNAKVFKVKGGYHELHNEIYKYRKQYFQFLKESLLSTLFEEAL